jgi:integrase
MASVNKVQTKYGVRYRLNYRDEHGVQHKPEFKTKADADEYAKANVPTRTQRANAVGADPTLLFRAWALQWLARIHVTLKPRAYDVHDRAMRLYLIPRLGDVPIVKLRRGMILDALVDCQARGGWDKRTQKPRPLKPGSIRTVYSAIRCCLQAAVNRELIAGNPAAKLGGAKGELRCEPTKKQRRQRVEQRVLDLDELGTLTDWTARQAAGWLPLLLVYARAGLRLGEGVALEVDDFSAAGGGSLRVNQAINFITGELEPPKFGPRIVDLTLSPELVRVLQAQVAGLKRQALKTGRIGNRWLFPSSSKHGTPLCPRNVNRKVATLARAAGLPRPVSPQDLRHTYATLLIEAGCTPAYVQQQLGHSSIQLTIDTYAATAKPRLPAGLVGLFDRRPGTVVELPQARQLPKQ